VISESAISVSVSCTLRWVAPQIAVEERDQPPGLDELDAVIGAEVAALVVPPVDVADLGWHCSA
jgi:citrate lyase beta subunit